MTARCSTAVMAVEGPERPRELWRLDVATRTWSLAAATPPAPTRRLVRPTLEFLHGRDGLPLTLSALEYRLIAYLALQPGRVTPPSELLEHLYGDDDSREANALEALVARLRRKVGPGVIGTRRGFGYFLEDGAG